MCIYIGAPRDDDMTNTQRHERTAERQRTGSASTETEGRPRVKAQRSRSGWASPPKVRGGPRQWRTPTRNWTLCPCLPFKAPLLQVTLKTPVPRERALANGQLASEEPRTASPGAPGKPTRKAILDNQVPSYTLLDPRPPKKAEISPPRIPLPAKGSNPERNLTNLKTQSGPCFVGLCFYGVWVDKPGAITAW